ncbi:MAG TPA: leucyl aminopeptidase family protein [Acidimicrobiales bacterium]
MARTTRVSSIKDALGAATLAVPVVMKDGAGTLASSLVQAGIDLPTSLSAEWCSAQGLSASAGSFVLLRSLDAANIALVSIGEDDQSVAGYRLAGASAVRAASDGSLAFFVPTDGMAEPAGIAQALVEGVSLAAYDYKKPEVSANVDVVPVGSPLPPVSVHDEFTRGAERGARIAEAVNWAKRLIDVPASSMPPKTLAAEFEGRLGTDAHTEVRVWTESKIRDERLGGLLGVGLGSAQPTRLVYTTYDPEPGAAMPHVALVGKGVTFDSGGLSLKPAESMMTMKTDMSGAAIVMAATSVASQLGLRVRITAIAPLTENLVGDNATKPGDVLTIRNGLTIEVLNTDAEGRLILADALSLAAETNPDAIIDVATLTGAQKSALGVEVGALFSTSEELADQLLAASAHSGEALWRMPLVDAYEADFDSDVADIKNIGKPLRAGAIIGALILRRFTGAIPWAHLDIAGPARADASSGWVTKGATAFSVRTLVEYLTEVAAPPR